MKDILKNRKGFTLIELLVVIAIIGLLSTMSVVALNNAREKARNARRVADIKQIQTALELYLNDQGVYPTSVSFAGTGSIATNSITYMAVVPASPTPWQESTICTNSNYIYTRDVSNPTSYSIYYCLSEPTGGIPSGPRHATPSGINN